MAATDDYAQSYAGTLPSMDWPLEKGEAVTPSDTVELTKVSRALYVGVTGDVTVILKDGTSLLFKALPVGLYPIRAKRIANTGTTATNLLALS